MLKRKRNKENAPQKIVDPEHVQFCVDRYLDMDAQADSYAERRRDFVRRLEEHYRNQPKHELNVITRRNGKRKLVTVKRENRDPFFASRERHNRPIVIETRDIDIDGTVE